MILDLAIIPEIIAYSLLFGISLWLLYRKYIYSFVDTLFVFVFTTTFSCILVMKALDDVKYIAHFFICQLCVWLGFVLVQEKGKISSIKTASPEVTPRFTDVRLLQLTTYVLFCIYVLANLIILQTKGFALLSDAPSSAKVANFQEGFGIFRKINWAIGGVASAGLMFLYLYRQHKFDLCLLLLMMALTSLEGSKSALVRYAIGFGILLYHPVFHYRKELINRLKPYVPFAAFAVFGVFFAVLMKENESGEEVLVAFVRRLLYSADSVLYFYHPVNIDFFSKFTWLDFPTYIINPVLGFLRIAPYQEAFGNVMVENALPPNVVIDVFVGPNTSFYVEGQVFFGYYGAFVYSFVLGALASWIRLYYFSMRQGSAFYFVFLSTIYQFSAALLIDVKLFITQTVDAILLVIPIYILVCLVANRRIVIRWPKFASTNPMLQQ